MSAGEYTDFLTALGQNESGNNYGFTSSLGYLGRYQFGEEALQAVGFYNGDGTAAIDFVGSWTAKAQALGVFDKASFLASTAAQDAAGDAWFHKIGDDINSLSLGKYVGQTIDGIDISTSGLVAGAHLVGVWALKSFLESGGAINTVDGYGTPVSQYVAKFGGYDTPISLTGAPAAPEAAAEGVHTIIGGDGDDWLWGAPGANYIRGGAGGDQIQGGSGFDDINGNTGADTAHGNAGDDWVVGGQGDDQLYGDAGNDIVWGNLGNDTLDGGDGDDQVRGGQGDDSISGGAGNDFVSGDRGNDTISGGAGADVFHGSQDAGIDKVLDFHWWEGDHVQLDAGTTYTLAQVGADTVIDMGGGNEMILVGVQLSSLPSGWII